MEAPRILFPHNPLSPRKPDFDFESEFEAAQAAGFEVGVVDTDALELKREVSPGPVLYRGWMLTVDRYAQLSELLVDHGLTMVTDSKTYRETHHLPRWYALLKGDTPASHWYPEAHGWSADDIESQIGPAPWIVKDYVKSAKHDWHEACYIPNAERLRPVTERFLELRGEDLEGGLVYRTYHAFRSIGIHPKSGLPLTLEFRAFFWKGRLLAFDRYWGEVDYPMGEPPWEKFQEAIKSVSSPLFTLDVACDDEGRWWVVELGDGQVSGLPPTLAAQDFYHTLYERIST